MFDVAVIGCGVIGAAAAFELSKYQASVVVLEKENDVAMGATRANSAIIHAGYDPKPGTLMARLNVQGNAMTEQLCKDLDVPFERIGSFVLAFSEEEKATVQMLYERGVQNGVPGLKVISGDEVREMDPLVSPEVVCALYAPSAGIITPWEYALAFAETAVRNGAEIRRSTEVTGLVKIELREDEKNCMIDVSYTGTRLQTITQYISLLTWAEFLIYLCRYYFRARPQ